MIARRRFLQAAASSPAVTAVGSQVASEAAATTRPEPEGTLRDLGPASVASPLGNGEFVGNVLYLGSRGLSPNVVGDWDLGTNRCPGSPASPGSSTRRWRSTRSPTPACCSSTTSARARSPGR